MLLFGGHGEFETGLLLTIIQLSYTVRIPIFWLVDLYHVTMGCDETTFLTSLLWCNSHHCHYIMASADSIFDDFCLQCIQFQLNKNVSALIARELSGFTCTHSLTMNSKFLIPHSAASCERFCFAYPPAFLPPVISSFFPKIEGKGGGGKCWKGLDPPPGSLCT